MSDKLLKAITKDGFLRIYAIDTKNTVNQAQKYHSLSPVCAAALGRLMTAGILMGTKMKGDDPTLTLQVKGDGPIGLMVVVANSKGEVKGYCSNPIIDIPLKENGKLDVGTAVGHGMLGVIKDLKMKEPYVGQVPLQTGEIAEDIAYYYMQSEQVPSVVALGVLVDRDYSIKSAGGYIIEVMPDCDDETISKLERSVKGLMPVTEMFENAMSLQDIIKYVMLGFDVDILEEVEVSYDCDCSIERMQRAIISLGKDEINNIINDSGEAEITCHFCDRKYTFDKNDLNGFLDAAKNK